MEEKIKYGEIAVERAKLLMKYSLNKTLSENKKKGKLLNEVSSPIEEAIKTVESMGFTSRNVGTTYEDCKSGNQVFAKAALYGLKKITDTQINRSAIGNYDCLTVKVSAIDGNSPKPYTIKNFSTSSGIKQKLNGKVAELITNKGNVSVGSLFFLESFYFEWPKIINDYKESFKYNKDAYKSTLFPDGWLTFFNYWYGTSMFDEALNSVRDSEKFRCNGGKLVINTTYGDPWQEDNFKDTVGVFHVLLPIGSIVISIIFPPTWLALGAAALLELGDAALYLKIDKDPYAAGLAAIFAFVPGAQLMLLPGLKKLGTEGLKKLLRKVISKEGGYIDEELKALKEIHKDYERLSKLAKLGMAEKLAFLALRGLKTAKDFLVWSAKLIDAHILNPNSLVGTGLVIGGTFITWDKIAAINGICNAAPLKSLQQSDWKILKGVGYVGKYLQPYSSPCDLNKAAELLDKHNNLNTITSLLQKEVDGGTVFNQDFNGTYNIRISLIQKLLIAGGFDKDLPKPQWSFTNKILSVRNGSTIKNIKVLSYPGSKVKKEYTNTDKKSNFTFNINGLTDAVYILMFENYDGTSEVSKLFYLTKTDWTGFPQSSKIGNMKEGYYDKRTELAVINYQKKNGLTDDGLAGPATIKSILSDYKSQKYGLTKKELNTWNLDAERVNRVNNEFNAWMSDVESKRESGMVSMVEVNKAFKVRDVHMVKLEKVIVDVYIEAMEKPLTPEQKDLLGVE